MAIGFGKGTWSLAEGLYETGQLYESETNPLLNVLDAGAHRRADDALGALVEDPLASAEAIGKGMVAWDEWSKNPNQAAGELVPGLLLAAVTGGAGSGAKSAEAVADAAAAASKWADAASRLSDFEPALLNARGTGEGPHLPMNPGSVREVAKRYGIDISDLEIVIAKSRIGYFGSTGP